VDIGGCSFEADASHDTGEFSLVEDVSIMMFRTKEDFIQRHEDMRFCACKFPIIFVEVLGADISVDKIFDMTADAIKKPSCSDVEFFVLNAQDRQLSQKFLSQHYTMFEKDVYRNTTPVQFPEERCNTVVDILYKAKA